MLTNDHPQPNANALADGHPRYTSMTRETISPDKIAVLRTRSRNSRPTVFIFLFFFAREFDNPCRLPGAGDKPENEKNNSKERVGINLGVDKPPDQQSDYWRNSQQDGYRRQQTNLTHLPVTVVIVLLVQGNDKKILSGNQTVRAHVLQKTKP
jgi:hypothetical protein